MMWLMFNQEVRGIKMPCNKIEEVVNQQGEKLTNWTTQSEALVLAKANKGKIINHHQEIMYDFTPGGKDENLVLENLAL